MPDRNPDEDVFADQPAEAEDSAEDTNLATGENTEATVDLRPDREDGPPTEEFDPTKIAEDVKKAVEKAEAEVDAAKATEDPDAHYGVGEKNPKLVVAETAYQEATKARDAAIKAAKEEAEAAREHGGHPHKH